MTSRKPGFALAYALVVSTILVTLLAAMVLRVGQTLRASRYDFEYVQARALAQTGAELAFNLLREDPHWYSDKDQPFHSENFGPAFSTSELGGSFEVDLVEGKSFDPNPFPENEGTYLLISCRGTVGARTACQNLSLKMTNPMINHVVANRGRFLQKPWMQIDGPVFIDSDPDKGIPGSYQFVQNVISGTPPVSKEREVKFGGEIRATGKITLASDGNSSQLSQPALQLRGPLPVGSQSYDDVDHGQVGGGGMGTLTITRPSVAEPDISMGLLIDSMPDLLATYRTRKNDLEQVLIPADASAVLVEFLDNGEVVVSKAEWKTVGRCFDRGLYLTYKDSTDPAWAGDELVDENAPYAGDAERITRAEVAWNDPAYPDAPYPPTLKGPKDLDGNGVDDVTLEDLDDNGVDETEGDYFDVKHLVRGARVQGITLNTNTWKVIYLTSAKTNLATADKPSKSTAPPVFVRGRVKGKAVVVYDATDDTTDPLASDSPSSAHPGTYCKFHMYVHADHEREGEDGPVLQSGGVPGGLCLVDDKIKTRPGEMADASSDMVLLLCRGSLRASGTGGYNLSWLVDKASGDRINYRDKLRLLDQTFATRDSDPRYKLHEKAKPTQDWPLTPFDGMGVAQWSAWNRDRVLADGQIVVENDPNGTYYSDATGEPWNVMFPAIVPPGYPLGVDLDSEPVTPKLMRCASAPIGCEYDLRGGLHSVGEPLASNGVAKYDYRWRDLESDKIEKEIVLPVGPMLLSRSSR